MILFPQTAPDAAAGRIAAAGTTGAFPPSRIPVAPGGEI